MSRVARIRYLPRTLIGLGLANVVRKVWYSLGIRTRLHPATRLRCTCPRPPFFRARPGNSAPTPHPAWSECWWAYGLPLKGTGRAIPGWHGPLGRAETGRGPLHPWWECDPVGATEDIKDVWEFSRLDWVVCMAQRVRCGDSAEATRLQEWLSNWAECNPPFLGANWECGQEVGIRVLHLALAALLLLEHRDPERGLLDLLEVHLRRIETTTEYAVAQQNNHASSEAAALFVGGAWLSACGCTAGSRFEALGRTLLLRAVLTCTCEDGTLSQKSVTYQRLFLDTLSVAELWRRHFWLPPFPDPLAERVRAGIRWLDSMLDPVTGDAPNVGGNDGAMLLPIGPVHYRDFRPSVRLAGSLFNQPVAAPRTTASEQMFLWLGVDEPQSRIAPTYALFPAGGFMVARGPKHLLAMRLPVFRFRPVHADALHIDLWVNGRNVVRDSGSFRYSGEPGPVAWFPSTAAHSTAEFDGRSQMPRLGKFLFGAWLWPDEMRLELDANGLGSACASYTDVWGASHSRTLLVRPNEVEVLDRVAGFRSRAVVRWHLADEEWTHTDRGLAGGGISLSVTSDDASFHTRTVASDMATHYSRKHSSPVFEAAISKPGTIRTLIRWQS
jgi:hypothetical protein